jgi:hypothetical protein
LDDGEFEVRETAEKKLTEFGELVTPALRAALESGPSAETKRRIESVLASLDLDRLLTGPALREIRAVQIAERIGSADARDILKRLAQGEVTARQTRAAKQALERLGK